MKKLFAWLKRKRDQPEVALVYDAIVAQSRNAAFYSRYGVADSLDGRFDMLALHMVLVLRRLKAEYAVAGQFSQALFDRMFVDMDESLREIGVGDMSIGKRVKHMGTAFYGRLAAYETAFESLEECPGPDGNAEALTAALVRNIYRGETPDAAALGDLLAYVRAVDAALFKIPIEAITGGNFAFQVEP